MKTKMTFVVATAVMAGLLLTGCSDTNSPKPTPSATAVTYPEPKQIVEVAIPSGLTNDSDWVAPKNIPFNFENELGSGAYELSSPTLREPALNAWSAELKKKGWSVKREKNNEASNQYNFIAIKGNKLIRVDGSGGMKAASSHDEATPSVTTVRISGF